MKSIVSFEAFFVPLIKIAGQELVLNSISNRCVVHRPMHRFTRRTDMNDLGLDIDEIEPYLVNAGETR
jgi:hypothetical protein